jgi:hypothetical protein
MSFPEDQDVARPNRRFRDGKLPETVTFPHKKVIQI